MEPEARIEKKPNALLYGCIQQLGNRKPWEQEWAERELRRMGAEAVEPLLSIMDEENRRLSRRHRLGYGINRAFALAMLLYLGVICLAHRLHTHLPIWVNTLFYGSLALSWTYSMLVEYWLLCGTRRHRKALAILMDTEDLRIVGPLCACLEYRYLSPERALITLLPRLQSSDAHLLNAHQRACLYNRLRTDTRGWFQSDRDTQLTLAILKALEQIGNSAAVPFVEEAIKMTKLPQVRATAQQCLPYLMQRAEQERATNSLLRPSNADEVPDTMLLRAAQEAPAEPQQLLRASLTDLPPQTDSSA